MKDTIFYYTRDNQNRPAVTTCLVRNGDSWARGVATCNVDADNPCRRVGRFIAEGRARKAKLLMAPGLRHWPNTTYDAILSDYERELIRKINEKEVLPQ